MKFFRRNSQKENRGSDNVQASLLGNPGNTATFVDNKKPNGLINLTVICPAMDEDGDGIITVQCNTNKTIGDLKLRLQDMTEIPFEFLQILQDPQGEAMDDNDALTFHEGDVVYLRLNEMEQEILPLGEDAWAHGDQCAEELIDDLHDNAEAEAFDQALADSIKDVQYCLSFVLPGHDFEEERRCMMPIGATAMIADVTDVVRLELGLAGDESFCLHFAGQPLAPDSTVHEAGLRDDDTVLVGLSPDLLE